MQSVIETVRLKDGTSLTGIVDFVSSKQIYFFDFTNETQTDFVLIAVLWKGNQPTLRFSVFCACEYPSIKLPRAILIPISNIVNKEVVIKHFPKPKQRKKYLAKTN